MTLTTQQIPAHSHAVLAATDPGNQANPAGSLPAQSLNVTPFINDAPGGAFQATAITAIGGSQPHTNFQPYLCVNYIISLFGIFPSPT